MNWSGRGPRRRPWALAAQFSVIQARPVAHAWLKERREHAMGLNVDLLLEPDVKAAHPENDIRGVILDIEILDIWARAGGHVPLSEMGIADESEVLPEDLPLFHPRDGIRLIRFLLSCLNFSPKNAKDKQALATFLSGLDEDPKVLTEELEELLACLQAAQKRKARFRFMVA